MKRKEKSSILQQKDLQGFCIRNYEITFGSSVSLGGGSSFVGESQSTNPQCKHHWGPKPWALWISQLRTERRHKQETKLCNKGFISERWRCVSILYSTETVKFLIWHENIRFNRARISLVLPSSLSFVSVRLSYCGAYETCRRFPRKTNSSNFLFANL